MALAPIALAQVPAKENKTTQENKSAQETSGIFHRLEVMRRVLNRSIADLTSEASDKLAVPSDDVHRNLRQYYEVLGRKRGEADGVDSRVDYLPGYGAIFTLTAEVPVRVASGDARSEDTKTKTEDGLWEKMEQELRGGGSAFSGLEGTDLFVTKTETARFEFDPARLESLKQCLATTLARYGQRLDLGKQEWIGVSIRLLPTAAGLQSDGTVANFLFGYLSEKSVLLNQGNGTFAAGAPRGQRLVFQIPAGDLAKLTGTDSDATTVLDKAEIDLMVSAMTMQVADRTSFSRAR